MDYALIGYPLSGEFRQRFEALVKVQPEYLNMVDLRKLPLRGILRRLRGLKAQCLYVVLEDAGAEPLRPILEFLACVASAKKVQVVTPELKLAPLSRWNAIASMFGVALASLDARRAIRACRRELNQLAAEPRIEVGPPTGSSVLYLRTNLWFGVKAGGSVGHIAGVVNGLVDRGYEVEYASVEPHELARPAVKFLHTASPRRYGLPPEANLYRFQEVLVQQLRTHRPPAGSFIYQRMSLGNHAGVVLSRLWGLPLVLEYNGSEVWVQKHWGRPLHYAPVAQAAEDVCLKHAHAVVTVSDVLRDELVERGVEPRRIVSYPNCIDPAVFDPARFSPSQVQSLRKRYGIDDDAVVATFIGTFGQWHGVDVLAKAIAKMTAEQAPWLERNKVVFLIVGDGMKMPVVREILPLGPGARFYRLAGLVAQAEAPLHLAASDVLLSPHVKNPDGTRFFGSPTKLFEYMAMGKGIVASDLDQIGEVLQPSLRVGDLPAAGPSSGEGRLAVMTAPGSMDGLIEGIRFLVENPQWRTVLGANVRRQALAKYTWSRHVEAILRGLGVGQGPGVHGKTE